MSKRTERREADRKLAYQLSREQPPVAASVTAPPAEPDLLARAHAFFDQPVTTTDRQIQANRANARQSTGPLTPEGKAISSRNNTRHGLTGESAPQNFQVLPNEDQNAYNQNLADFQTEWKPATATEHDLVNRLAMHQWLRLRALRLQDSLFTPETGEVTDIKKFELYRRYETSHERGFNKAFADLLRLRSFQLRQQNGFESQRRKNAEHELKMQRLKDREERQELTQRVKPETKIVAESELGQSQAA